MSLSKKKNSKKSKKSSIKVKALKISEVYSHCNIKDLPKFKTTEDLKISNEIYSQDRAIQSIKVGLGIRKPGYNIYVSGVQGTGKVSVMRSFLESWSERSNPPSDWIYVHDFSGKESPNIIQMPDGLAKKYKKDVENLVKKLREKITETLRGEKFENNISARISSATERKSKLLSELETLAKGLDLNIKLTQHGIEASPIVNGENVEEKDYYKLSTEVRQTIEGNRAKLEPHILEFARQVRGIDSEAREYIDKHRDQVAREIIRENVDLLLEKYHDLPKIMKHLESIKESVVEDLFYFVYEDDETKDTDAFASQGRSDERDPLKKYRVNIFIDNSDTKKAPIIIENNPTYYNLFGKIEKSVENGIYSTDFTMVKAGTVHRANGGYLVLNADDLLQNHAIWDTLKRVLRTQAAFIEDMGEQFSLLPTSGLRPEAMPLDIKVILIGTDDIYHLLYDMDEDFTKIFKVKADFDYRMNRNRSNIKAYANFISTRCATEKLIPFDSSAVASVVEFGSRLVEDQDKLSTQFGQIKDLVIEADFMARQNSAKVVKRVHVEEALSHKYYRHNLYETQLLEMLDNRDMLISVDGSAIGQVNGLTVLDLGDYTFGRVIRLTASSSVSADGFFSVDRASRLSGKIHDKGLFICISFLKALLAKKVSLGIASSICFEQSYGGIDGDSASITILCAVLSSFSKIPIMQNYAMTGSVNQFGEVQPIGGVNEKIEGFFKTASIIGKKSTIYNVIIPKQNVSDLMLSAEVREAVKEGKINILPVSYLYEAFELITGVPLGAKTIYDEKFPEGSALAIIEQKLKNLADDDDKSEQKVKEVKNKSKSKK